MNLIIDEIVDLSLPIKSLDTPMYPGFPQPQKQPFATIKEPGALSYLWTLVDHTGTHIDAAAHIVDNGLTVDQLPVSRCVGKGVVLDFSKKSAQSSIGKNDISTALKLTRHGDAIGPGWILLFYTGYSAKARTPEWLDHPALNEEASEFIADLEVNAIGFDAPSPDRSPSPAHKILLPKGIGNYENLVNLERLLEKDFLFVGEPLPLVGSTGSPVRAIAIIIGSA
ncbi:MAG TPA: cyclase family protein [Candidatus Bathyarchaeia archaeon]|nr:cyclase family protein [Candidatus Bathyarchaeia archaeon]